jgi:4'-phosphopantetheinyl transferase
MTCEVVFAPRSAVRASHEQLLTPRERARWERLRRDADRERFCLATVLVKAAVARRVGLQPADVVVDRSCVRCGAFHGRPRIVGHPLQVSLSHSGDFVAVVLSDRSQVGIDIEAITDRRTESLVRFVCSPEERGSIASNAAFTTTWARKESVLKAVGVGLNVPMTRITVTAPGQAPALLAYRGGTLHARLQDVTPGEAYAGCVTVLGTEPPNVTFTDSTELLASLD